VLGRSQRSPTYSPWIDPPPMALWLATRSYRNDD
jgi:hypothetical protein